MVPAHKEKVLTSGGMLIASGKYIDEYISIRSYFLSLTEDKKMSDLLEQQEASAFDSRGLLNWLYLM